MSISTIPHWKSKHTRKFCLKLHTITVPKSACVYYTKTKFNSPKQANKLYKHFLFDTNPILWSHWKYKYNWDTILNSIRHGALEFLLAAYMFKMKKCWIDRSSHNRASLGTQGWQYTLLKKYAQYIGCSIK